MGNQELSFEYVHSEVPLVMQIEKLNKNIDPWLGIQERVGSLT